MFLHVRRLLTQNVRRCTTASAEVPSEAPKGTRLQRIGAYFKNIFDDYKMVAVETVQDIKDKPVKATIYFSILGTMGYFIKHNPSEKDFHKQLTEYTNELLLLGDPIRNPISDKHMQNLVTLHNRGEIRRFSLGVFCLIWHDNYEKSVDLYEAQCKHLKVGWLDMKDRILDVGILDRWIYLEKAMIDYDINPNDWPEEKTK